MKRMHASFARNLLDSCYGNYFSLDKGLLMGATPFRLAMRFSEASKYNLFRASNSNFFKYMRGRTLNSLSSPLWEGAFLSEGDLQDFIHMFDRDEVDFLPNVEG